MKDLSERTANYSAMSDADFDTILDQIVAEDGVHSIMAIPGVSELVREHYNNDVLDKWADANPQLAYPVDEEDDDELLDKVINQMTEYICKYADTTAIDEMLSVKYPDEDKREEVIATIQCGVTHEDSDEGKAMLVKVLLTVGREELENYLPE